MSKLNQLKIRETELKKELNDLHRVGQSRLARIAYKKLLHIQSKIENEGRRDGYGEFYDKESKPDAYDSTNHS